MRIGDLIRENDAPLPLFDDIAFDGKNAYVAIENEGILPINVVDTRNPKESSIVKINYQRFIHRKDYESQQSIKINTDILSIITTFPSRSREDGGVRLQIFDKNKNAVIADELQFDWSESHPFFKIIDNQYMYVPILQGNTLYFEIFGRKGKVEDDIEILFDGRVERATPSIRSDNHVAIITNKNHLWIVDIDANKLKLSKDFNFDVRIKSFYKNYAIVDSYDKYILIDINNLNSVLSWPHADVLEKDSVEILMTDSFLLENCKDYAGREKFLKGYSFADYRSIHQVYLPFSLKEENVKWIFQFGVILFVYTIEGTNDRNGSSNLRIVDCSDSNHPRLRGTLKNINVGPKGFKVNGNRIYILDAALPSEIPSESWKTYLGVPKSIDISDLDHPVVKGIYHFDNQSE